MNLPQSNELPIRNLSKVFNKTTNSYKFYWFYAILDWVRNKSESLIPMHELLASMVTNVWYPVNYFKIIFGKQDRLGNITLKVKTESHLSVDSNQEDVLNEVFRILDNPSNIEIQQDLTSLLRYVPYRFLRPWFSQELRGLPDHKINAKIVDLARRGIHTEKNRCLYRFRDMESKCIEIPSEWLTYLKKNNKILMEFCLWNLLKYLQKNNPNVPNISGKLFPPQVRNLTRARKFWDIVLSECKNMSCIYSEALITRNDYSIDHFIPWRFVTHDLNWNLIPTPKFINSSKSDFLPSLEQYFHKFASAQHQAFKIIFRKNFMKLLEDYSNMFHCELRVIYEMPEQDFRDKLYSTIAPLTQIAQNMGFETNWIFR